MDRPVTRLPKDEIVWEQIFLKGELSFLVTSKSTRDFYYAYSIGSNGDLKKLGKARTPVELWAKFLCSFIPK